MSSNTEPELLRYAARRARERETFVAFALAAYQEAHDMDDAALAAFLGCSPEQMPHLALCGRPDLARFQVDVREIAEHTGANPMRLARVLREADTARAWRDAGAGAGDQGLLMAARDRISEEPAGYDADGEGHGDEDAHP